MTLTELGLPEFEIVRGGDKYVFKNYTLLAYDLSREWTHKMTWPADYSATKMEGVKFTGYFKTPGGKYLTVKYVKRRCKRNWLQVKIAGQDEYEVIGPYFEGKTDVFSAYAYDDYDVKVVPRDELIKTIEVE
jgi:hypothetical protein